MYIRFVHVQLKFPQQIRETGVQCARESRSRYNVKKITIQLYYNIFFLFQTSSSSKRLSLPVLHYGMSLNDISMKKSPAHRTRSSTEFGSSKSPPYSSEQHLSRRSRRMSLVSALWYNVIICFHLYSPSFKKSKSWNFLSYMYIHTLYYIGYSSPIMISSQFCFMLHPLKTAF